jgi:hypothetical protein
MGTKGVQRTRQTPREAWLPLAAVAGPVLFTITWFVLGFVSPGYWMWDIRVEEYSAISQPISGLGLGSTAPVMNSVFVISGILIIVGVIGIFRSIPELSDKKRRILTGLLALHGVGAVIDGLFTLESIMVHLLGFTLALSPIVTFLVLRPVLMRIPRYERYARLLPVASITTLVLAVLHFATFNPEAAGEGAGIAGLTQRILIVELQAWIVALAWLSSKYRGKTSQAVGPVAEIA